MVFLRKLNNKDLPFLQYVENNSSNWNSCNTVLRHNIKDFISLIYDSKLPLYKTKQLRFVICLNSDKSRLGFIDLFEIDFINRKAGVSIIIAGKENRSKGYGSLAISKLIDYAYDKLRINFLYCNISNDNIASIKCFRSVGFVKADFKNEYSKSLSVKFNKKSISQFVCT